jgi:hypothetical protein
VQVRGPGLSELDHQQRERLADQYVQTQESHVGGIPDAVARRQANDERFNVLLGAKQPYGWREEGPDYDVMARNPRGLYD